MDLGVARKLEISQRSTYIRGTRKRRGVPDFGASDLMFADS